MQEPSLYKVFLATFMILCWALFQKADAQNSSNNKPIDILIESGWETRAARAVGDLNAKYWNILKTKDPKQLQLEIGVHDNKD